MITPEQAAANTLSHGGRRRELVLDKISYNQMSGSNLGKIFDLIEKRIKEASLTRTSSATEIPLSDIPDATGGMMMSKVCEMLADIGFKAFCDDVALTVDWGAAVRREGE
jgi:hypothetical protein